MPVKRDHMRGSFVPADPLLLPETTILEDGPSTTATTMPFINVLSIDSKRSARVTGESRTSPQQTSSGQIAHQPVPPAQRAVFLGSERIVGECGLE